MPSLDIMPAAQAAMKPRSNSAQATRALLQDRDTFGTVLLIIAVDCFGTECLSDSEDKHRGPWHATTFRQELEQKFGVQIPQCNIDKLMAAASIITSDMFFKDVHAFIQLANILAGDEFDPLTWEKADTVECAWAITEALLLDPPGHENSEPFSDDIRHYIAAVLQDEGFVTPPDVLKIAVGADISERVNYDFSDDPDLFQGIYANQKSKTEDVEISLLDALTDLKTQLSVLSLDTGDTSEVGKQLDRLLEKYAHKYPRSPGPENVLS